MNYVHFKLHLSHKFSPHKRGICSVSIVKDCGCLSLFYGLEKVLWLLEAVCGAREGSVG